MVPSIESPQNPKVQLAAKLAAGRRIDGMYILEGARSVEAALQAGPVEFVLAREGSEDGAVGRALAAARERGATVYHLAQRAFERVAATEHPAGILAVARERPAELAALLEAIGHARRGALAVVVRLSDPGNLGSVIRTARAFGLAGLVVVKGSCDPFGPKVVRATAGAVARFPIARVESVDELAAAASAAGVELVAAVASGGEPPERAAWPERAAILIGSEAHGLEASEAARCERAVTIATAEGVESLNAAAAFAVLAHAWRSATAAPQGEVEP